MKFNCFLFVAIAVSALASCSPAGYLPAQSSHEEKKPHRDRLQQDQIIITETFDYTEEELARNTASEEITAGNFIAPKEERDPVFTSADEKSVIDTIYPDVNPVDEALYSEEVADRALIWGYMPLTGFLFGLLGFLVALIGFSITMRNFRRLQYVTQEALDTKERARRAFRATSLILFIFLALLIALIFIAFLL